MKHYTKNELKIWNSLITKIQLSYFYLNSTLAVIFMFFDFMGGVLYLTLSVLFLLPILFHGVPDEGGPYGYLFKMELSKCKKRKLV